MAVAGYVLDPEAIRAVLARELPDLVQGPLDYEMPGYGCAFVLGRRRGRKTARAGSVIVSQAPHGDGREWIHASIARDDRMPSYWDLVVLHRSVFGARYAYQVFAPPSEHINIHEHALHLWGCLEGDGRVLPDFGVLGTV